jgi:hypothetical protein
MNRFIKEKLVDVVATRTRYFDEAITFVDKIEPFIDENFVAKESAPAEKSSSSLNVQTVGSGIMCHIICNDTEAHGQLINLCQRWHNAIPNSMFIDWEQSLSRKMEMNKMATELPWEEKINTFQINPHAASIEDISRMATELSDRANEAEEELKYYKQALTKAVSLPKIAEDGGKVFNGDYFIHERTGIKYVLCSDMLGTKLERY